MEIPQDKFVCRSNEVDIITTDCLSDLFDHWKKRDYILSKSKRHEILRSTTPYIKMANLVVLQLWRPEEHARGGKKKARNLLDPVLLLLLQLIGTALTRARMILYLTDSGELEEGASLYYRWGQSDLLKSHMLELGWCQSIASAFASKELDVQHFAASLKPPLVEKNHINCSARTCNANFISEEQYQVKHTSDHCKCFFLGPVIDNIVSIVRHGGIPLICLQYNASVGGECLRVVQYHQGMLFVAISHVWKDGLGNPFDNSLPLCQIQRIQKSVCEMYRYRNELHEDREILGSESINRRFQEGYIPIWMDTFCIPVQNEHKNIRKIAIATTRQVYEEAHKTLAIDAEIKQLSLKTLSWRRPPVDRVSFTFHFWMGAWNSRLWTLQEGRLSKDVNFVLDDGILSAKDLLYRSGIEMSMLHDITSEASSLLNSLCFTDYHGTESQKQIRFIILAMRNRQTSRSSDETICIAGMLGLNPSKILDSKPEHRMQVLLESLESIPPALLFMGEPRLAAKGFRWAPSSFMHRQDRCYEPQRLVNLPRHPFPDQPPAELMRDGSGLMIVTPGLQLSRFDDLPQSIQFLVQVTSKNLLLIARYSPDIDLVERPWEKIIMENRERWAAFILPSYPQDYLDAVDCVLVVLREPVLQGSSVISANVVCSFQVHQTQTITRATLEKDHFSSTLVEGTWLSHQQVWIVD